MTPGTIARDCLRGRVGKWSRTIPVWRRKSVGRALFVIIVSYLAIATVARFQRLHHLARIRNDFRRKGVCPAKCATAILGRAGRQFLAVWAARTASAAFRGADHTLGTQQTERTAIAN
jgi:hypothetical protein